ncbi:MULTISPECIES: PilC/PilY family type IV pilus protein [Acinetobacter]|uniref:PilC/PilY family type IV pilus protein n=1 Tax=Acinetobacter TaxID=469 RepID=UPI00211E4D1D|nr:MULTISPECIES: PilC/PilY family type IV pilus protein [Acinetobacter]
MRFIQKNLKQTALNKAKLTILAASITTLICNSVSASDIEIYTAPTTSGSTTTLMMMLDVSGSMRVTHPTPSVAMDACDFTNPRSYYDYKVIQGEAKIGDVKISYDRFDCRTSNNRGNYLYRSTDEWDGRKWVTKWRSCKTASCGGNNTGSTSLSSAPDVTEMGVYQSDNVSYYYKLSGTPSETKFDRITRLKDAMVLLLVGGKDSNNNDVPKLDNKIILGLSTLGAVNGTSTRNAGTIVVPARRLDADVTVGGRTIKQRQLILEKVLAINPISGTPTANSYAETAAYLLGKSTSGLTNTGFDWSDSSTDTRTSTGYTQPASIKSQVSLTDDAKSCHAQGIYVLTDGEPNDLGSSNDATGTRRLVRAALDNSSFSCDGTKEGWDCIFKLNENLADKTKNKSKVDILTAVIGFGKGFTVIPSNAQTESEIDTYTSISQNVRNTAKWGIKGNGGWYSGESTDDIVESFSKFLGKVKTNIPGVSTGTATIPVDALNSSTIQPFGYFPQFVPKVAPTDLQQTWYGNLKKYHAVNGSLYGTKNGTQPVMQKDEIKNVADEWNNPNFTPNSNEVAFMHGALSQLIRGYRTTTTPKERLILSDFVYKDQAETKSLNLSTYDADAGKTIYQAISTSYNLTANAPYREALMNLLGYENAQAGVNLQNLATDAISKQVPQIGAILHSKPILLTQEGKPTVIKGADGKVLIDTTNRKDYILFGSTQGLLHVLDAKTGKEKFAFLPYEMIKKQSEAFKYNGGDTRGGKSNLHYGIDGEWTAHTTYVSKSDGTLSVDGGKRTIVNDDNKEEEINLKGKQWVYGGLRMGGRSYYALDLTDLDAPKVKFHIDPENSKVHYLDNKVTKEKTITELSHMGQSWSKPTLAYVNWHGSRKLVMIVGGGYDEGYESPTYDQDSADEKKIGAGVYMFDADDGDLLWSVSGNYSASKTGDRNVQLAGNGVGMDYSIVSSIKTVDRNNDGLVDHLYFGDLRGQAFRVDFNPSNTKFESQVTKILDLKSSKRRFYEQPTFTIHHQKEVAAVSIASGDRSSPMYGKSATASTAHTHDGVFVVYDYDVFSHKYPNNNTHNIRTLGTTGLGGHGKLRLLEKRVDARLEANKKPVINSNVQNGDGGWYYLFDKEENLTASPLKDKQILKSFAPLIAVENDLYVPVFDASKAGTTGSCSAGVAGETSIHRFCMPYGICSENIFVALGAGIGEPIMGGGRDGDNSKRSLFILNEDKKGGGGAGGTGGTTQIKNYGGALKFIPNRWYEQYAQGGG